MRPRFLAPALLALSGASAAAQTNGRGFCWLRTQPAPACRSFLVMEAAVEIPFATTTSEYTPAFSTQTQQSNDYTTRYVLSVGGMVNRGPSTAVGGTMGFVLGRSWRELPARAELRVRNWQGKTALDFSAGPTRRGIAARSGGGSVTGYGGTAAVGVEYGFVGADLRVDAVRAEGRNVAAGFVGGKAVAAGAPIAVTLATLALFALVASIGN